MSAHTPGPWLLHITGEHGIELIVTGSGGRIGATTDAGQIAKVSCIPTAWGDAKANAALIATTPEQHALLIEALDLVPRISDDDPMAPTLAEWCRNARALIAKAEGQS